MNNYEIYEAVRSRNGPGFSGIKAKEASGGTVFKEGRPFRKNQHLLNKEGRRFDTKTESEEQAE